MLISLTTANSRQREISHPQATCGIKATDDLRAVETWLQEYISNKNTYNTYKAEVTKFLFWCQREVQLEFATLKKEDLEAYIAWLKDPPLNLMISPNDKVAVGGRLKLFKCVPSFTGLKFNIRVVNLLLNYLVEADYIYKNPLRLIKQFTKFQDVANRRLKVKARILEDHEFKAVVDTLNELPETDKSARDHKAQTKLIFALLYHLGLRVSELSASQWDNFKIVQGRCWYFLIGKGNKPGQIPVNDELLGIVKKYREYVGSPGEVGQFASGYILRSKKTGQNLSSRRIREIVKAIFALAAGKFTDKVVQAKLRSAFPHDLRHLLASDLDKRGVSIIDTKEILRHASENTTEIYRHSKESKRHAAIQSNQVGMTGLLNSKAHNYTVLIMKIECRLRDDLSFGYFINAVVNIYLKKYKLAEAIDIEQVKSNFNRCGKSCSELQVSVVIAELLVAEDLWLLRVAIERAAVARGLKVTVT